MKKHKKVFGLAVIAAIAFSAALLLTGCSEEPGEGGKTIASIEVTKMPTKTQYNIGEEIDTTGMEITVTYSDGSTLKVTGFSISGYDKNTAGNQTITVTYQGKTAEFTVNVKDPGKETAAKPTANPPAGAVISGTTVTLATTTDGAEIWYTTDNSLPAKDGTASTKYTSPITITTAVTIKAIAVKDGMNDSDILEAAYTISSGGDKTIVSIEITTPPTKSQYNIDEELDTSGMVVTATYSDESKEAVTGYSTSGYDKTTAGNQTITVTYQEKTAEFTVNVKDPGKDTAAKPTANPPAGAVTSGTTVTLTTTTAEAEIWYTTGNTIPAKDGTASTKYTSPITITTAITIKAIAVKDGMNNSDILEAAYTISSGGEEGEIPTFTDIDAFGEWLSAQPDNTAATAYKVALNVTDIAALTATLGDNTDKYVYLDLSGSTITTIPDYAFIVSIAPYINCATLTGITIPNSVTSIGNYAFYACTSLTSVNIPNSVISIGKSAFAFCTSLTSVTIPDNVTTIGEDAFASCYKLTAINVDSGNTAYSSQDGVLYNKAKTSLIQYPGGKAGAFTIPNSVTSIGKLAFNGCTGLTSVIIPDSVTSIGMGAFISCTELISVTIPNSVTSIGGEAFRGTSLTSVIIPDSVTIINSSAFRDCTSLASITIPDSVTSIDGWAFENCTSLASVTISDNVTYIGSNAFQNCTSLTSVIIPDKVTYIGSSAFQNCTSLTSVMFERAGTNIANANFPSGSSLQTAYTAGGIGTYTRPDTTSTTWTKQ